MPQLPHESGSDNGMWIWPVSILLFSSLLRWTLYSQHPGNWCLNLQDSDWGTELLLLFLTQTDQCCLPSSQAHSTAGNHGPLVKGIYLKQPWNLFAFLLSTLVFLASYLQPSSLSALLSNWFYLKKNNLLFLISLLFTIMFFSSKHPKYITLLHILQKVSILFKKKNNHI